MDFSFFQLRVAKWLHACFGDKIAKNKLERSHRFLEEALELCQATGVSKKEALTLVEYVYARGVGEPHQEVGGVTITLAALCYAHEISLGDAAADELFRVHQKMDKIREKQATKPTSSALPQVWGDGALKSIEQDGQTYYLISIDAIETVLPDWTI